MAGSLYNPGRYWGKATAQSFGKSKNKGTPQFAISFDILGATNPNDPDGELLRAAPGTRTVYWYITDKTVDRVAEDLERLGFNKPSLRFLSPEAKGCFDFTGTDVELYCEHEEYEGKWKERWSLAFARTEAKPVKDDEIEKLDAMFGDRLKELASKAPATEPAEEPADEYAGVDDSPF